MKQTLIFDMDGVLVNTEPMHYRIWKQVFEERGVCIEYEKYIDCIGSTAGYLYELIWKWHGVDFRNDPDIPKRFRELKNEIICAEGIPAVDGVPETIRTLYNKGYRLAVASSSPQIFINLCIEKIGLSGCFTLLFSGETVPHPKPAPDTFLHTAQTLGAAPEDCIVIEDSRNGTLAAKAAGMTCIGFCNPDSGRQDLSAADRIIQTIPELLALLP